MTLITTETTEETVPKSHFDKVSENAEFSERRYQMFLRKYTELSDIVREICTDAHENEYDMSEYSEKLSEHDIESVPMETYEVSVVATYSGVVTLTVPKGTDVTDRVYDLLRDELPSSVTVDTDGDEYPSYSVDLSIDDYNAEEC